MPLIPQSVAGEVLMDFDSLKAAQSGLGTVRVQLLVSDVPHSSRVSQLRPC